MGVRHKETFTKVIKGLKCKYSIVFINFCQSTVFLLDLCKSNGFNI